MVAGQLSSLKGDIVIPQSVTFKDISYSVTSIEESAFSGCGLITSVIIPDSVTSIGKTIFFNCSSLTKVVIPVSVKRIDEYAFRYCSALTDITYNGIKEQWDAITKHYRWDEATGDYTIHCTDGDISKS